MLYEPPPQRNIFDWVWIKWIYGFWQRFNDLASTATDDGTKGFHLVSYPPKLGESGVTNYEYPYGDVRRYGAVGDGVTDDTLSIQAAIDSSDAFAISPQGGSELYFQTGIYVLTDTLTVDHTHLIGTGSFGCTFLWNGAAGGTVLEWRSDRHKRTTGFRFRVGSNTPGIWIDCTSAISGGNPLMDWGDWFEDIYFEPSTITNMRVPAIINFFMRRMRFSAAPNIIEIEHASTNSNNRVFSIDDFTIDFGAGTASPTVKNIISVDSTGSSDLTIVLSKARIESTIEMAAGNRAIVNIQDTTGPNLLDVNPLHVVLDNIGFDIVNASTTTLVYQDTTQTNVTSDITLKNVLLRGITQVHGGNWNSFWSQPEPETANSLINFWSTGRIGSSGQNQFGDIVTLGKELRFGNTTDTQITAGTGTPEGNITADRGSIYLRTDGSGGGYTVYFKTTDSASTGWKNASIFVAGGTGGTGSAGAGNQYIELDVNGVTYKVLHDGTV